MPVDLPDVLAVPVPVGGRVLVASDLMLPSRPTAVSRSAAGELIRALEAWDAPGVLVFAGNLFDLLEPEPADIAAALDGHGDLTRALVEFSGRPGHRLVCIPGSRDGRLAWDQGPATTLHRALGAELALAVELEVDTGAGPRRVRVESGRRFDPRHRVGDERNPAESPLGQHVLTEVLPAAATAPWTAGVGHLADPAAAPRFLLSRAVYRGAARHAWWLLVPVIVAIAVKYPLAWALVRHPARVIGSGGWGGDLALVAVTTGVDLVLAMVAVAFVGRRTWMAVGRAALGPDREATAEAARAEARSLVTAGATGLVVGQALRPELTTLGPGFFACTGAVGEVVEEHPAWLGLPPVFLARRLASWVELEAGAELHVRLLHGVAPAAGASRLERLLARDRPVGGGRAEVVAAFPQGRDWPVVGDPGIRLRRVRRLAAAAIATGGLVDLVSALTPPLRNRIEFLKDWVPLSVSQAADAVVALAGLGLLFLANGVRRGQRRAWGVAVVVLGATAVLNLVKGIDFEEAAIDLLILGFLGANRSAFAARADLPSLRRAGLTLVGGALTAVAVAMAAIEVTLALGRHTTPLGLGPLIQAVAGRMVGLRVVALPHRLDLFLRPALVAVTFGLAVAALWLASRPVVGRQAQRAAALVRAREMVGRHGTGTLDYFALRSDKDFFFFGQTVVAYGVYGAVCLVSPDPIGPPAERVAAWDAFRDHAYARGWSLAVLGAGEEWLPVYRDSGMHDMYVGDEGVLDVRRLDLQGGRHKSLRQAVNRVAKYGYTIAFHDPARVDEEARRAVEAVMTQSRRGDVERGFSMTLGRIFDPEDRDLLLAVASDGSGRPVAFCQYVPAPGIQGYSLDLMRREEGEHPNGLIDFLIVETARHLRERGLVGLGLNFATMRAVLAGEAGDTLPVRVERWMLKRMSGSMQIESLWRFNAKFDPRWQPRYLVYDAPEHLVAIGVAVARAESFWELPIIGRFLVRPAS